MLLLWCPFCQKNLYCDKNISVKKEIETTVWTCPSCGNFLASKDSPVKKA